MQVCTFFFLKHEREKEIRAPLTSSPACPRGANNTLAAPPSPCSPASGRRNPPRSPGALAGGPYRGRPVATSPPPRRCPPSPALGRGPCRGRPRHPGLPGAFMLLECGRRGPRVLGNLRARPPARPLTAPAPAGLARGGAGKWGAGHSRVPAPSSPRPPHSPAKSAKGSSSQYSTAPSTCGSMPGGPAGVRPGSPGSRGTRGLRGASGVEAPWLTGRVAARAAGGGQDPPAGLPGSERLRALLRLGPGPAPAPGTALPGGKLSARFWAAH